MIERERKWSPDLPPEDAGYIDRLHPVFKLVFLSVLFITLLSLALALILVLVVDNPNEEAKSLMDACLTIVNTGFGAVVGLIGGSATQMMRPRGAHAVGTVGSRPSSDEGGAEKE